MGCEKTVGVFWPNAALNGRSCFAMSIPQGTDNLYHTGSKSTNNKGEVPTVKTYLHRNGKMLHPLTATSKIKVWNTYTFMHL